jgi:hypothetical protein
MQTAKTCERSIADGLKSSAQRAAGQAQKKLKVN